MSEPGSEEEKVWVVMPIFITIIWYTLLSTRTFLYVIILFSLHFWIDLAE